MMIQLPWLTATTMAVAVAARPWAQPQQQQQEAADATYFFTFGNSYTQTNFLTTGEQPSPANPMGNPALGEGTTTGGANWVGYLTTAENASLVLSYNLAIGGATVDNTLVKGVDGDLVSQVKMFGDVYASKPESAPWTAENAVFGFWIGVNDIGNVYSSTDADTFIPKLTSRIASLLEEIYKAGGRKFLLLNVPPTSRSPLFLGQGDEVVEQHAAYLAAYNKQLAAMVEGFEGEHEGVTTVVYDSWTFMTSVLDNPEKSGFPDATCINEDGTSCVWWNDYHPSAKYQGLQAGDMKGVLEGLGGW